MGQDAGAGVVAADEGEAMQKLSRRNFLGWSSAGAMGLLVPQIVKPRVSTFVMGSGFREPVDGYVAMCGIDHMEYAPMDHFFKLDPWYREFAKSIPRGGSRSRGDTLWVRF
jgi:hypothetical protein